MFTFEYNRDLDHLGIPFDASYRQTSAKRWPTAQEAAIAAAEYAAIALENDWPIWVRIVQAAD